MPEPALRIVSRRAAIGLGVGGVVGLAGAASLFDFFSKWRESEAPADIFKGDAPSGELWELWQKRGWVKEGRHYLKLGRNVQCKVCPNNCILEPGDRSHCRNKINRDGTLYTLAYGNPCTFHVDPVEKKPLFHFLPGTRAFPSPRPAASSAASTARTGRFRRRNRKKPRTRAARNCVCARRCLRALRSNKCRG